MEEASRRHYGYLWRTLVPASQGEVERLPYHVERVEAVLPFPVASGRIGLDAGTGAGQDAFYIAKTHPDVEVIGLDVSDGIYEAYERTKHLGNVHMVGGSILGLPFREGVFDFVYCYGVLHHTPDPRWGFGELVRVASEEAPVVVYVYEDHADNLIKRVAIDLIHYIRRVTVRLSPEALMRLCFMASPLVVMLFSWPARFLSLFATFRDFSRRVPFNFGGGLFSVAGDLYDRLGAQIESRFGAEEVLGWYRGSGLTGVHVEHMIDVAGWLGWGFKTAGQRVEREPQGVVMDQEGIQPSYHG
jgi:SAM-dependent methyltransferase